MAIWLVRAGSNGEYESKFLDDKKIYLTWDGLSQDLSQLVDKSSLYELLRKLYDEASEGRIKNHAGQIWSFAKSMQTGDWVVLPSKTQSVIHIGEIKNNYQNHSTANNPYFHSRKVDWFATDIPRSNFDQDILYSLGAFLTICRITRNDAENRIKAMAENQWKVSHKALMDISNDSEDGIDPSFDIEQSSIDQIAKLIIRKYKGNGLADLINAILKAQGFYTHVSPSGPDKGIDILAAKGELGFESPKICVQVKSSEHSIERSVLDQLLGTMQMVHAEQGLLVSWGGFKSTVYKEVPGQFFKVRLWDQKKIIEELFEHYDKLDEKIKAEIPLKRVWTLALNDDQ